MTERATDAHDNDGQDGFDPEMQDLIEEDLKRLYEPPDAPSDEPQRRRTWIRWMIAIALAFAIGVAVGYTGKASLDKAALKGAGVPDPGDGWKTLKHMDDVQSVQIAKDTDGSLYFAIHFKNGVVMEVPHDCCQLKGEAILPGLGDSKIEWMIGKDSKLYVRTLDKCVDEIACEEIGK